MFITKPRLLVLEIPKCGSRSLVDVAQRTYGKKYVKHQGHKTMGELLELVSPQQGEVLAALAVVRHPVERLVSQVSMYAKQKKCGITDALIACIEQSHIVFKPQYEFVGDFDCVNLKLFPIEKQAMAQSYIAGTIVNPIKKNVTRHQDIISETQIKQSTLYEAALAKYAPDFELYARSCDA